MSDAVSTLVGIFVIAGILAAAFVVGRASNLRATIKDQRDRIETLDGLLSLRDRELLEERAKIAALEIRFTAVEAQAQQFSEIVSGRVDYSALETIIAAHHAELTRQVDDLGTALHDIKKLLEAKRIGDQRER